MGIGRHVHLASVEALSGPGRRRSLRAKRISESQTEISQLMQLTDANPLGKVHGGVIMRLADEVGGIAAARHSGRPAVTIAIDSMAFYSPISVGDLVTVKASLNYVGHTSMEVGVRVEAENILTGQTTHTNSAYVVYVAIDRRGRPVAVPPLLAETPEEKRRMEDAERRQEDRLRRKRLDEARVGEST
jgi:acyl-CoA hydrolase